VLIAEQQLAGLRKPDPFPLSQVSGVTVLFSFQEITALLNLRLPYKIVGRSSGSMLPRIAFATSLRNPPNPQHPDTLLRARLLVQAPSFAPQFLIISCIIALEMPRRKLFSIVNGNHDNYLQSPQKYRRRFITVTSLPFPLSTDPLRATRLDGGFHLSSGQHNLAKYHSARPGVIYQHVIVTDLWLLR
jgi:hypothetical protein